MSPAERIDESLTRRMLAVALDEARHGLSGIPIGAALFHEDGTLLGRGHNRRVQDGAPSMHAETAAFRAAGRRRHYTDCVMATTLSPCWYCSGLLRQFGFGDSGGPQVADGLVGQQARNLRHELAECVAARVPVA